jgi:hypothetical protein
VFTNKPVSGRRATRGTAEFVWNCPGLLADVNGGYPTYPIRDLRAAYRPVWPIRQSTAFLIARPRAAHTQTTRPGQSQNSILCETACTSGADSQSARKAGLERISVDFGVETDRGKRFALWAQMFLLRTAPDLDVAFNEESDREAARSFKVLAVFEAA